MKNPFKKYLVGSIALFLVLPFICDVLTFYTKIADHAVPFSFVSALRIFSLAAGDTILIIVSARYDIKKSFWVAIPFLIYEALITIYSIIINQEPITAASFTLMILLPVISPLTIIFVAKLSIKLLKNEMLLVLAVIAALFFINIVYRYFYIAVTNYSYGTHFIFSLNSFKLPLIHSADILATYFLLILIAKRHQVKEWILHVLARCK